MLGFELVKKIVMDSTAQNSIIFMVDDDIYSLNFYGEFIRNLGYRNVKAFEKPHDCLDNMIFDPKIIFLDHEMPGISGLELLREVKRTHPDVIIVMLTGQQEVEIAVDLYKEGIFAYIMKGKYDVENIYDILGQIDRNLRRHP